MSMQAEAERVGKGMLARAPKPETLFILYAMPAIGVKGWDYWITGGGPMWQTGHSARKKTHPPATTASESLRKSLKSGGHPAPRPPNP